MEQDKPASGAQGLWQSVLLLAVEDALYGPAQISSRDRRIHMIETARRYLTQPSADLAEVCALAGMDMQAIIDRMRQNIAAAPSPEELASKRIKPRAGKSKTKAKRIRFEDRDFTMRGETRTAAEWCGLTGISIGLSLIHI